MHVIQYNTEQPSITHYAYLCVLYFRSLVWFPHFSSLPFSALQNELQQFSKIARHHWSTLYRLHMGPNNLCYVTRHLLFFPRSPCHFLLDLDVTFYSFYKRSRRISTTVKVAVSHFVFYPCGAFVLIMLMLVTLSLAAENHMHQEHEINMVNWGLAMKWNKNS